MSIIALSLFPKILIGILVGIAALVTSIKLNKRYRLWQKSQSVFYLIFGRSYECNCGHKAKRKTMLTIDGESGIYTLDKEHKYCPQCWINAAIKCAWCSNTIIPGDAITLYTPQDKDFKVPEHAVVYKRTPHLQLVGCLGWNCADTGMDRSGFWIMPGKVQRAASPMEMMISGMSNGDDGMLIVNNLSNPNEAVLIPEEIAKPGE
ncbi:hypothetical protein H0W32_02410 [Patescibacteria group bacterium]|nr:hypothetical protein [Patescibacteria group bacterium]